MRTTDVSPAKIAEQVPGQLMPAGALATIPFPVPEVAIVSLKATLTVNASTFDVPPPGAGVDTVTCGEPAVAMSVAEIIAWSRVAFTKVVGRPAPFHWTTDAGAKSVPVTVNVKPGPPAFALDGDSMPRMGAGFGLIVSVAVLDVPPAGDGLKTVT
jgi:hypothetical protein